MVLDIDDIENIEIADDVVDNNNVAIEDGDDTLDCEDEKKLGKKTILLQDVDGYKIYKNPNSFILYNPSGKFEGYYTTLAMLFIRLVDSSLTDKLLKRTAQEKQDAKSLSNVVQQHREFVITTARQFKNIKV